MTEKTDFLPEGDVFHPLEKDGFNFACHPDVPCFNACCADLNLILTPYDILRLKNRLGVSSQEFLDTHTISQPEMRGRFPGVQLKMTDNPGRPCPFVTPAGCSIYEDRPGACRTYPLGRGSASGGRETYFLVKEAHCQGFEEKKHWNVDGWLADQGLSLYNELNDAWMEIITAKASLGPAEHVVRKIQMFFMVSYNLDRFRDFTFGSRFLDMFEFDDEAVERFRSDDVSLLRMGFDWLNFSLFGQKTMPLKDRPSR
jgi:Fe-S-cluster containining protein